METQYAKVEIPGYGTKEFPVENGLAPTPSQVKEWMQYNPEIVATWKKVDHATITKEAIDDVAKHLGPIDRAQLYTSLFFDSAGNNISNAAKFAKENPDKVAKGAAKIGLEAGGATLGQAAGVALGGVGVAPLGAFGGAMGNVMGQMIDDENPFSWGDVGAAAVMGAIPGATLANASARQVALKGAQYALAGVAADTVRKGIDEKRAITGPEALSSAVFGYGSAYLGKALDKAANAPTRQAAKNALDMGFEEESRRMGRELGFVLPPTEVNNSPLNQKIQSLSGIIDPAKDAIRRNQLPLQRAIKQDIGIGVEVKFDGPEVFETAADAVRGTTTGSASRVGSNGGSGVGVEFRKTLGDGVDKIEGTGTAVKIPRDKRIGDYVDLDQSQKRVGQGLDRIANNSDEALSLMNGADLPVLTDGTPIDYFGSIVPFRGGSMQANQAPGSAGRGFFRNERSVGGQSADTHYDPSSFKQSVNMNGGQDSALGNPMRGPASPRPSGPVPVGGQTATNTPVGGASQSVNMGGASGSYTPDFKAGNALNPDTLPFHIARFTKSYNDAGSVSDAAAAALADWRKANYNARQAWWSYRQPQGGSPEMAEMAKGFEAEAELAFQRLSKEAAAAGRKDLTTPGKNGLSRLQSDRMMLGRLGAIEAAMNRGNGYIDADVLGRLLDAGAPLDGNLLKAARFNLAYGKYLKDKATTTAPGTNRFGAEMAQIPMALAGAGAAMAGGGNPVQVLGSAAGAAAVIPAMRMMTPSLNNGARRLMFSEAYQNALRPDFGPTRMDMPAAMARYAAARKGQDEEVQAPLNQYLRR